MIVVGIDLGTSSVKILATETDGRIVAFEKRAYPTASPERDAAEQDLRHVERATAEALAATLATIGDPDRIGAIGLSCAMHGIAPVDAGGEPLGPLVTWLDRRSLPVARRWRDDGTAAALYRATGAPVHPMLPSCKIRAFRDANADAYLRAVRYVSAKETIVARLTGEWAIDFGTASGTGFYEPLRRRWHDAALAAAGISASSLSPLAPPSTSFPAAGPLARDLGIARQTRVVLGSSDGAMANFGTGAGRADRIAASLGSSGAVRIVGDTFDLDDAARTFCYAYDDTRYLVGGATGSGGAVLAPFFAWLLPEVAPERRFERAIELASRAPRGAGGVVVRPDLAGARAPSWDAARTGSIDGLSLATTREDLLRALIEGVVDELVEVFALVAGRAPTARVRIAGGNLTSPFIRQLFADRCGRTLLSTEPAEASAFGAAMSAARSIGAIVGDDDVAALVRESEITPPRPLDATYAESSTEELPLRGRSLGFASPRIVRARGA